jgi:hypothetical protein
LIKKQTIKEKWGEKMEKPENKEEYKDRIKVEQNIAHLKKGTGYNSTNLSGKKKIKNEAKMKGICCNIKIIGNEMSKKIENTEISILDMLKTLIQKDKNSGKKHQIANKVLTITKIILLFSQKQKNQFIKSYIY